MDSESFVSVEILPPNYDVITERDRGGREQPPTYNHETSLPNHQEVMREENMVFDLFENIMSSSQMDSQRSSINRSTRGKKTKKKTHHSRLQANGRSRSESEHLPRTAPNSPLTRLAAPLSPLFSMPTSNFLKRRSLLIFGAGDTPDSSSVATRSEPTSVEISRDNSDLGSSDPRFYTASSSMGPRNSGNSNPEHSCEYQNSSNLDEDFYTPQMQFEEISAEEAEQSDNNDSDMQPSTSYASPKAKVSFLHHILSPPRTPKLELDVKKLMTPETEPKQLEEDHESDTENCQNTTKNNISVEISNASKNSILSQEEGSKTPINSEKSPIPQNQRLLDVASEENTAQGKSLSGDSAYIEDLKDDDLEINQVSNLEPSGKSSTDEGLYTIEDNLNNDYINISPTIAINNQTELGQRNSKELIEPVNRKSLAGSSSNASLFKEIQEIEQMIDEASRFEESLEHSLHSRSRNHSMVSTQASLKTSSQICDYNQYSVNEDNNGIICNGFDTLSVQIDENDKTNINNHNELGSRIEMNDINRNLEESKSKSNSSSSNTSIVIVDRINIDNSKNYDKVEVTSVHKADSVKSSKDNKTGKAETTWLCNDSKNINNRSTVIFSKVELVNSPKSDKELDLMPQTSNKNKGNLAMDSADDEDMLSDLRDILKNSLSLPSNSKKCRKSFLLLDESPEKSKRRRHTLNENVNLRGISSRRGSESKSNKIKKSKSYSNLDPATLNNFQSPSLDEIFGKGQSLRTRIKESKDFISKLMKVLLSSEALETIKKLVVIDGNPSASNDYYYFREVLTILDHIIENNLSADRYFDCMNYYLSQDNDEDKLCHSCHQSVLKSKQDNSKFNLKMISKSISGVPDSLNEEDDDDEELDILESAMRRSIDITSNRVRYTGKEVPLVPRKLSADEEDELEFAKIETAMRRSIDITSNRVRYTGKEVPLVPRKLSPDEEDELEFAKVESAMRRSIDITSNRARYTGKEVPLVPRKLSPDEEDELEFAKIENAMQRSANISGNKARYSGKQVSIVPRKLSAEEEQKMEFDILEKALNRSSNATSDSNRFLAKSTSLASSNSGLEVKYPLTREEEEDIELDRFESNMRQSLGDFNSWGREVGLRRSVDSLGTREMYQASMKRGFGFRSNRRLSLVSERFSSKKVLENTKRKSSAPATLEERASEDNEDKDEADLDELEAAFSRSMSKTADPNRYKGKKDIQVVPRKLNQDEVRDLELNIFEKAIQRSSKNTLDSKRFESKDVESSSSSMNSNDSNNYVEDRRSKSLDESYIRSNEFENHKPLFLRKLSDKIEKRADMNALTSMIEKTMQATDYSQRFDSRSVSSIPKKLSEDKLKELEFYELDQALQRSVKNTSDKNRYSGKDMQIVPKELNEEELKEMQFNDIERALSKSTSYSSTNSRYGGKEISIVPRKLSEEEYRNLQFEEFEQALNRSFDNTFDESRYQSTIISPPNEYDLEQLDDAFKRLSHTSIQSDRYGGKNSSLTPGILDGAIAEKQAGKSMLNFALVKTLRSVFSSKPVETNPTLFDRRASIFMNDDLEFLANAIEKTLSATTDPTKFEASQVSPLSLTSSKRDSVEREVLETESRTSSLRVNANSMYLSTINNSSLSIQSLDRREFKTMLSSIRRILSLKSKINERRFSFSDDSDDQSQTDHIESMIELNNLEASLKKSLEYNVAQRLFSEETQRPDEESLDTLPESEIESLDKNISIAGNYSNIDKRDSNTSQFTDNLEMANIERTSSEKIYKDDKGDYYSTKSKSSTSHKSSQGKSKIRQKVFSGSRLSWSVKSGANTSTTRDTSQKSQNKGKKYLDFKQGSRKTSSEAPQKPKPLQVKLNGVNTNTISQPESESVDDFNNDFESLENAIQRSLKVTSDPRRFTSQKLPSIISMDNQESSSSDDEFGDLEKALSKSMNRTRDPTRYASDKLATKYQGEIQSNGPQYIIKKSLDEAEYSRKIKPKRNNNAFMAKGGRPQSEHHSKEPTSATVSKDKMLEVFESELYQSLRSQATHYGKALDDCYHLGSFTTSPSQYDNSESAENADNKPGVELRLAKTHPQMNTGPSNTYYKHDLPIQARRQQQLSLDKRHSPLTIQVESIKELERNLRKSFEQAQQSEKLKTMPKPKLTKLILNKIHSLKKNLTLDLVEERSEPHHSSEEMTYRIEELEALERTIRMSIDENNDSDLTSYRDSIIALDNILEEEDHSVNGLQNPNKILIQKSSLPDSDKLPVTPVTAHSISSLVLEMKDIQFANVDNLCEAQDEELLKESPKQINIPQSRLKTLKRSKPLKQAANLLTNTQLNQPISSFSPTSPNSMLGRTSASSNRHSMPTPSIHSRSSIGDNSSISDMELDILDQALNRAIENTIYSQRFSLIGNKSKQRMHRKTLPIRRNSIIVDHYIEDELEDNLKTKVSTKIQNILSGQESHELTEQQLNLLRDNQSQILKAIEDPSFETKCTVEGDIRVGDTIAIFQNDILQIEDIDSPTVPLDPSNNDQDQDKKNARLSTFIIRRDTLPGEQELEVLVQVAVKSRQGSFVDQRKSVDSDLYH